MTSQRTASTLFVIGIGLMATIVVLGKYHLAPILDSLGVRAYQAKFGDPGMLKFLLFAVGFPLGAGLTMLGGYSLSGAQRSRTALLVVLTLVAAIAAVLVQGIFGTKHSPAYFGVGGITIGALVTATFWYWGHYRRALPETLRASADLQACGYLWFAVAAWNTCGFGGMPSYAIYPQKLLAHESLWFAVAQLKSVMACFVLGWVFTALGMWRAARARAGIRSEIEL
ncbi:MAG: hypothetical protein AMJ72_05525 [Acidithiobacillales bacterium SM1_46]|nr:MAG: hypothetical protein AMJ72_05525 [Acidithiobacillales bacterium SM1_46]